MNHWTRSSAEDSTHSFVACTAGKLSERQGVPHEPSNTSAMDRSLTSTTRATWTLTLAKVTHGTATRATREILCQIMPADQWTAIEIAAKADIGSEIAEAWRMRAGYFWDA